MARAIRTVFSGKVHTPAARLLCCVFILVSMRLYQLPTRVSSIEASNAAKANHATACWPYGITMSAASNGPMALPPLPPTWNIDWARLFFPPDASCATRDASGWNTDEPQPMSATDSSIGAKPGANANERSPVSVKHIPSANEYGCGCRSA